MSVAEKGETIAANNVTIAENEQKVFDAGYSKAQKAFGVKNTESGAGLVVLDHVNSESHIVNAKAINEGENLLDACQTTDGFYYYEDGTETGWDDYDYFVPEMNCYENCFPYYNLALQSGDTYKISGYARDAFEETTAPLVLMVSTSEEIGAVEGETLGTCSSDGSMDTWTYFELSFTVPDDVTSVYFYLSQVLGYKDIVLKKDSEQSVIPLTVCGKNLFDSSKLLAASGWTETNGVYRGLPNDMLNLSNATPGKGLLSGIFLPNTQYTLSFTGYSDNASASKVGMAFGFKYDDGTYDFLNIAASSATNHVFTSAEHKTIVNMISSFGYNYVTYLSNIQLEKGAVATEYEPYAATTYTTSGDLYSSMTFEYNENAGVINDFLLLQPAPFDGDITKICFRQGTPDSARPEITVFEWDGETLNKTAFVVVERYVVIPVSGVAETKIPIKKGQYIGVTEGTGTVCRWYSGAEGAGFVYTPEADSGIKRYDNKYITLSYELERYGIKMESIAPTMTVVANDTNVHIECEYYQDGAAVKEELTNAIISLGGTI